MIKINLAARKRALDSAGRSAVSGTGLGTSFDFGSFTGLFKSGGAGTESLKDLPIRRAVLPLVVGMLASFYLDSYKEEEIGKVEAKIAVLDKEKPRLVAETAKLGTYEALKKSLEADEFTIRTKIDTIQKLIKGRTSSPKMLTALAMTVPTEVWLNEIDVKGSEISLQGRSTDFTHISDFMRNLGESAYYSDLTLKDTQQIKDEDQYDVAQFDLTAKRGQ